jgi:fructosamine-3-kinase
MDLKALEQTKVYVGEIIEVVDLTNGKTSNVLKISGNKGVCIIKFGSSKEYIESELFALTVWKLNGLKVPNVLFSGIDYTPPFLILEYIDFPRLSELMPNLSEREKNKAFKLLGVQMRMMHTVEMQGYGALNFSKEKPHGELDDISKYLKSLVSPRIRQLKDKGLYSEVLEDSLDKALSLINENKLYLKSTLLHEDLLAYNCFYNIAAQEIFIFDPNTKAGISIFDVGITFFKSAIKYEYNHAIEFLNGYIYENDLDISLIKAGIIIKGIAQMATWATINNLDLVEQGSNLIANLDSVLSEFK